MYFVASNDVHRKLGQTWTKQECLFLNLIV